jgi:hypothetical protein
VFPAAIRAADPGEARAGVAAVEVALDDFSDDRPEISVFPLEAPLVLDEEEVEVMEKHPVQDGALRMSRTVDSRHIGKGDSKSMPGMAEAKPRLYQPCLGVRDLGQAGIGVLPETRMLPFPCILEPADHMAGDFDGAAGDGDPFGDQFAHRFGAVICGFPADGGVRPHPIRPSIGTATTRPAGRSVPGEKANSYPKPVSQSDKGLPCAFLLMSVLTATGSSISRSELLPSTCLPPLGPSRKNKDKKFAKSSTFE